MLSCSETSLHGTRFLLAGLVPTSGMTISWTGLAKGNIETAAISISNNDSDENPYQLTLNGEGSTISVPEMNLKQAATDIPDSGSYNFDSQAVGSDTDVIFTIENTGTADLALTTPLTIEGVDANQFNIQADPASTVQPGETTTFTVRFSPTSGDAKTAMISISNNDSIGHL